MKTFEEWYKTIYSENQQSFTYKQVKEAFEAGYESTEQSGEAVGYLYTRINNGETFLCKDGIGLPHHTVQPLYTHPQPAPDVPDGWRMNVELRKPGTGVNASMLHVIAPGGRGHITYYALTECHEALLTMLASAKEKPGKINGVGFLYCKNGR